MSRTAHCIGLVVLAGVLFALSACETPEPEEPAGPPPQMLTTEEEEQSFIHLFDGRELGAWRGFQQDTIPEGWVINDDSSLVAVNEDPAADLITQNTYANFELRLDFKVSEGGNSGIFYLVAENEYDEAWHTGPEYQILDDEAFPDAEPRLLTASNYEFEGPDPDVFRGAETWNTARIVKDGNDIEHWLNGERVVEYTIGSEAWEEQKEDTKFVDYSEYAAYDEGHIGLQHYGDEVHFRNIRIRMW